MPGVLSSLTTVGNASRAAGSPGADGLVLDTKRLVDLTLVTPAEDDMGVYGTDFGDGDYGEGEFPLVVLTPRQYEVIRARDQGWPAAGGQGGGFPEKPRTVPDNDFDEGAIIVETL